MNQDKKNCEEHSLLAKPIRWLIRGVLKYHFLFLLLMVVGAACAGLYAHQKLGFKNKRLDLINPKSEWNQYWLDYVSKFGADDDLVIVIDGENAEQIIPAINQTAVEIEKKPDLFYSLFYHFDDSALMGKALYFASDEELQDLKLFLKSHEDIFQGRWDNLTIEHILPQTVMPLTIGTDKIPSRMASNIQEALDRMILSLENAFGKEYRFVSPFPEIDISKGREQNQLPSRVSPQTSNQKQGPSQFPTNESRAELAESFQFAPELSSVEGWNPEDSNQFHGQRNAEPQPFTEISALAESSNVIYATSSDFGEEIPEAYSDNFLNDAPYLDAFAENYSMDSAIVTSSGNSFGRHYAYYPNSAPRNPYERSGSVEIPVQSASQDAVNASVYSNSICANTTGNSSASMCSMQSAAPSFANAGISNSPYSQPYNSANASTNANVQNAGKVQHAPQPLPLNPYVTQTAAAGSHSPFDSAISTNLEDMEQVPVNPHFGASTNADFPASKSSANSNGTVNQSAAVNPAGTVNQNAAVKNANANVIPASHHPRNSVSPAAFSQKLPDANSSAPAQAAQKNAPAVPSGSNSPQRLTADNPHIHYIWLNPGKTALLLVKMVEEKGAQFARGTAGIDTLRGILANVQKQHPQTKLQLTGLPVMENDEMRSSQNSMGVATWLSLAGVALLYAFFFRQLRHPMLALLALIVGIGWSMAYITFFVGHLNILSTSFAVILIGLGIDFGIHFTSRYLQCRSEGEDTYTSLLRSGYEIGPGILTGALTTAAAFFMAALTEFTGIAELGIIAGGGVLCCCGAALTILPVLIYLSDRNRPAEKIAKPRNLGMFKLNPQIVFFTGIAVIGIAACGLPKLYYDYNLMNLQPEGLESVELEMRLIEESEQSCWFAISMSSDPEVLRQRIEKFKALPSVADVEQLVTFVGDENPQIRQIHEILAQTPLQANPKVIINQENARKLFQGIETARKSLLGKPEYAQQIQRLENLQKVLLNMSWREYSNRMTNYQRALASDLLAKFNSLEKMSSPIPPALTDLPKPYVDRFRSPDGTYLLKIYAKKDLWDMENLKQFVKEVRSVDPVVTGNPLQTYECSLQMKQGYQDAAVYALAVVVLLLLLDLRSIVDTFFAISPVFLGLICTFGIMGFFNVPLNAANLIVLPLILGIGIDDGVHIVHDFRKFYSGGRYQISPSTSMSVILTSLTTILTFGTLMLAQHRGLQSLGLVLIIGTTCCWLASLLILPAMLNLFFSHETNPADSAQELKSSEISKSAVSEGKVQRAASTQTVSVHSAALAEHQGNAQIAAQTAGNPSRQNTAGSASVQAHQSLSRFQNSAPRTSISVNYGDDDFSSAKGCCATCYTWSPNGEIINSTGKAA